MAMHLSPPSFSPLRNTPPSCKQKSSLELDDPSLFIPVIISIIRSPSHPPSLLLIVYEFTEASAFHNSSIISQRDCNITSLIEAHPGS